MLYTSPMNACGLAGQLMRKQHVLSELAVQGCERSVITYSSLISACEKAGDWKLALEFFEECTKDNCRPNVITFNSLISACSQGAHSPLGTLAILYTATFLRRFSRRHER